MLRRNTVWFVGILLSFMASHTLGLSLGAVTVESFLNQPLRLRIEILQLEDTRLDDVTVQMASTDDFFQLGIERVEILSSVRFLTEESADGAQVLLTSNAIITEPYLRFVLETRWPSGRQLSEHTVLLDLPVFTDESARAENSLRQPISTVLSAPDAREETNSTPADAEPERTALPDRKTIETNPSSTLIRIARQIRPDESVSLQQTMIAIQALNPDAFADDNINRLLTGQILRLPTEQEIRSIDAAEALVEVGQQNQYMTDVEPFTVPAQTDSELSRPSGRLSVVAADSDATDASFVAPPASPEDAELDRRIAELESELSVRQEEATRARLDRENLDLRLADLDAQIEAAQELIRLQDIRLAQLRESLALAAAAAEAAAEEQAASRASDVQTTSTSTAPAGLLAVLTNNSIVLLGGFGLVISLLVWVMLRRNRSAALKDSGVLEPLVEMQAKQPRDGDKDSISPAANVFGSADEVSELEDHKAAQWNAELNEVMSASEGSYANDYAEKRDSRSNHKSLAADNADADSFLDDFGSNRDDSDPGIFSLDDDENSIAMGRSAGQKGAVSSDELEMTFDLLDAGSSDSSKEEELPQGEEVLDDLDFFSEEEARASEDFVLGPDEETATKLELAYAYQKMGDSDGAKEILHEVIAEGNESQITEARRLLDSLQATS